MINMKLSTVIASGVSLLYVTSGKSVKFIIDLNYFSTFLRFKEIYLDFLELLKVIPAFRV